MKFKSDLKVDFETYQKHPDTPIFHRIRFDSTNVYLTKSKSDDLITSKNKYGNYRVFPWNDLRAKDFLRAELNDESPNIGSHISLGAVSLIGRYNPTADDLTDIQYDTSSGKGFFKSARHELEDGFEIKGSIKEQKINSYEFMRMDEIIPTGAQGKAIYGEGNYIIDGPAGTGKSTTVLQKIKLLQKNEGIDTNRICILVKNEMVVSEFRKLLKSIDIDSLIIVTPREFMSGNFSLKPASDIKAVRNSAIKIQSCFNKLVKESGKLLSGNIKGLGADDEDISRILAKNQSVNKKISLYKSKRKEFVDLVLKNRGKIKTLQSDMDESVGSFSKSISDKLKIKNRKEKNRGVGRIRYLFSSMNDEPLSLGDEAEIRNETNKYKSKESSKLDRLKESHIESQSRASKEVSAIVDGIRSEFLSHGFSIGWSENEGKLFFHYINKLIGDSNMFHTIIIDEAQDVSLLDVELTWLLSKNVILTGDELQAENEVGIGCWENLEHLKSEFSKEQKLNVFTLRHNFRQTYELGSCSFNYRQLIMGKPFLDISNEYFENQKGFRDPQIAYIDNALNFIELVNDKINLIGEVFTDSIPVVIFYENDASLKRLSGILSESKIQYSVDGDKNKPVMFVSLNDIAGRSFPVVLAPLTNNTKENTIYIMLSRAKYDLALFTGADKKINRYIEKLLSKEIIVTYGESKAVN